MSKQMSNCNSYYFYILQLCKNCRHVHKPNFLDLKKIKKNLYRNNLKSKIIMKKVFLFNFCAVWKDDRFSQILTDMWNQIQTF